LHQQQQQRAMLWLCMQGIVTACVLLLLLASCWLALLVLHNTCTSAESAAGLTTL
jgi:hypothetical protein